MECAVRSAGATSSWNPNPQTVALRLEGQGRCSLSQGIEPPKKSGRHAAAADAGGRSTRRRGGTSLGGMKQGNQK